MGPFQGALFGVSDLRAWVLGWLTWCRPQLFPFRISFTRMGYPLGGNYNGLYVAVRHVVLLHLACQKPSQHCCSYMSRSKGRTSRPN